MSAGIFGGWRKQTADLSDKRYYSERPGIWTDKVTKSMRRPQVTDTELLRKRGKPDMDGFGNLMLDDDMPRITVERLLNSLTSNQRAKIAPRLKWELVEMVAQGYAQKVAARIAEAVC